MSSTPPAAVPSVDLADLASDDGHRRDRAAAALRDGFGAYGLVTIAGHQVSEPAVGRLLDAMGAFSALPDPLKQPCHRPDLWHQRGWTPPNTERALAAGGEPDFKECWFAAPLPLDPAATAAYPELFAPNLDVLVSATLQACTVEVGLGLHTVGLALLAGCERALGLDEGALTTLLTGAAHVTRALHYLPLTAPQAEAGVLWGEEHTDFNLLTVLGGGRFQTPEGSTCEPPDAEAGLYLRTPGRADAPHGHIVRGVAPAGQLVAQVGQQLEILTGGALQATPHTIRAPRAPGYTRSAVAHFLHAHPLTTLQPLAPFRTADRLAAYRPPRLAGTYAVKTLVDIGLAPPEALEGLGFRQQARILDARR